MKYALSVLPTLFLFFACNDHQQKVKHDISKHADTVYKTMEFHCETWDNQIVIDTVYPNGISFKIVMQCQNTISFIDTAMAYPDTSFIHHYRDVEYVVNYSLVPNPIIIDKMSFKAMLAEDLFHNGFLMSPHQIVFNEADSSVTFKTFIGHMDSDVGDVYVMTIDRNGISKVTDVEVSDTDDM